MGRWRRATPYFPHFELASTIFFFLSLRILSCFYNRSFFLFLFNSLALIQLYIRFFLPSHYELILSYLYFVFFVPSLSLLFSSTISSSLLEISMLESYILFPSSFVLHQGSFFSLFLSSLSSNARMLECYDASRCRYTFFLSLVLGSMVGSPSRYRWTSISFSSFSSPCTLYLPSAETRCIRAAFSSLHQENFFWFRFLASCLTLERCNFRRVFFFLPLFHDRNMREKKRIIEVMCNQEKSGSI